MNFLSHVLLFETPARLLNSWDFLGKNTGMGCHFLLQGIFPTQVSEYGPTALQQPLYYLSHQEMIRAESTLKNMYKVIVCHWNHLSRFYFK